MKNETTINLDRSQLNLSIRFEKYQYFLNNNRYAPFIMDAHG